MPTHHALIACFAVATDSAPLSLQLDALRRPALVIMTPLMLLSCLLLLAASHCSAAAQVGDLVWSEEFGKSGNANPLIWSHDVGGGGWGNGEIQTYAHDHVKVENGSLVITVSSNFSEWNGRTFTSGRIRSNEKLEFQYGTVVAKIKVPDVGDGLWPAFWMLGTTFPEIEWPKSGEIDVMELGSARALQLDKATTRVGSAIHWEASDRNQQRYNELDVGFDLSSDYHLYKLEWTPESITTFVNDIPIVEKNISNLTCFECEELHQPFFFVINMAVGGGYTRLYHEQGITADIPAELLVDYIRLYDNGHTKLSGSFVDTPPPTSSPTRVPTAAPTAAPTKDDNRGDQDNDEEESLPTEPPTLGPTNSPADTTTTSSSSPTASPSLVVNGESLTPTIDSPSTLPIQRLEAKGIQMAFSNTSPLNPIAAQAWSDVTRDFLGTQVTNAIGLVENVTVDVSLASQDPPFVFRTRGRRALDSNQTVVFDAVFQIQSVVDVLDVNRYIIGAFNTLEKKESYLTALQASDDSFANANDVEVAPAATMSRIVENPNNDNKNGLGIGLIVGIVLAILAILSLVAAIVYSRRRKAKLKKKHKSKKQESKSSTSEHQESPTTKAYLGDDDSLYNVPADTPSTCEESLYTSPSKGTLDYQFTCPRSSKQAASVFTSDSDFAEYIASFRHRDPEPVLVDDSESEFTAGSQTYDYSAAYKNMQGSIADSQSIMTGQVTQDDATIVADYVVNAPSGNLGIVLESSDDGVPVVQSIKKSSPLADKVSIGDRLLSVDGRDVSMVLVTTVSRIIASKKDNPTRQFVFARPMEI